MVAQLGQSFEELANQDTLHIAHLDSIGWISEPQDTLEGWPWNWLSKATSLFQTPIASVDVERRTRISPARKLFSTFRRSGGVRPAWWNAMPLRMLSKDWVNCDQTVCTFEIHIGNIASNLHKRHAMVPRGDKRRSVLHQNGGWPFIHASRVLTNQLRSYLCALCRTPTRVCDRRTFWWLQRV